MYLETFLIENNIPYHKGNLYGLNHIIVKGDLDITNARITEYPESLIVAGDLTLTSRELPLTGNKRVDIYGFVYRDGRKMDPRH